MYIITLFTDSRYKDPDIKVHITYYKKDTHNHKNIHTVYHIVHRGNIQNRHTYIHTYIYRHKVIHNT